MNSEHFFSFARARHQIYLKRQEGVPRELWTSDPILQQYRFTNVFRELDRTTVWFREHVRDPMRRDPDVLLATVLFRWFNRIATGEAIFMQPDLLGGDTAWFMMLNEFKMNGGRVDQGYGCSCTDPLSTAISKFCHPGPYVTGAYIIKTPDGYNKLDGVIQCIRWFMEQEHDFTTPTGDIIRVGWRRLAELLLEHRGDMPSSLGSVWSWLRQFPYLGDFMAYEVVTDLRHTSLLDHAPDIMTWANPGPGAARGLGRVFRAGDHEAFSPSKKEMLNGLMRELLDKSRHLEYWPGDWPKWEMRDVEHTLCEFDKYERARLGQGRPRGVYR